MRKLIVAAVVFVLLLIALAGYLNSGDNIPGGWVPSPPGSGWCVAQGIPFIPNGFRARCQKG